ncbi:hypothetical protein U9M48_036199 [Paspalum notatum var. saurae]|uniref:Reverse transcriptase domain-containing protein n=1 Tax=Paspalum notatum var. saurae TaxID=547442 RepID=A0AAQ3X9S7_PASNO
MWVDYKFKQLKFTYQGTRVSLQGIQNNISGRKLRGLLKHGAISHCIQLASTHEDDKPAKTAGNSWVCGIQTVEQTEPPTEIQELLHKYVHLFDPPTRLPPRRVADHQIPLVPGAQPVKVRPYRYSPAQKTEIEKQLKDMLSHGVVRPSTSPFASPVILVKKKDGNWRFCVDYRHLNAMTVKNKHPMPVVEELLDELAGACWFTKLDFSAGYHQICMAEGEEYKTAFRTHNGLY